MEGLTQEQIVEALQADATLMQGITTHITSSEAGKTIIENRANQIYEQKIGEKTSELHGLYDNDIFEVLGEKPGTNTEGQKMKTYEFNKQLLTELKGLREKAASLNKEDEVVRLNTEIERLKKEGGGAHWQQTFNTEQEKWKTERQGFLDKIKGLEDGAYSSSVTNQIENGYAGLKINPDVPKAAVDAMYGAIKADMIKNSKKNGEKVVFLDKDGNVITGEDHAPLDAKGVLQKRMADVLLKDQVPGGEAQEQIQGSIKTVKVEGKDDQKSLVLTAGSFKTRVEFMKVAGDALRKEGITKSNPDFQKLMDKAYSDYEVNKLPRN